MFINYNSSLIRPQYHGRSAWKCNTGEWISYIEHAKQFIVGSLPFLSSCNNLPPNPLLSESADNEG